MVENILAGNTRERPIPESFFENSEHAFILDDGFRSAESPYLSQEGIDGILHAPHGGCLPIGCWVGSLAAKTDRIEIVLLVLEGGAGPIGVRAYQTPGALVSAQEAQLVDAFGVEFRFPGHQSVPLPERPIPVPCRFGPGVAPCGEPNADVERNFERAHEASPRESIPAGSGGLRLSREIRGQNVLHNVYAAPKSF